jgi:hypothetical protein
VRIHQAQRAQRGVAATKSEARNPKFETNSNDQNPNDLNKFKNETENLLNETSRKCTLAVQRTAEQQNIEPQNFKGSFPSTFDIPYSIFDIRFPKVSFPIQLAASAASGWAEFCFHSCVFSSNGGIDLCLV